MLKYFEAIKEASQSEWKNQNGGMEEGEGQQSGGWESSVSGGSPEIRRNPLKRSCSGNTADARSENSLYSKEKLPAADTQ